MIDASGYQAIKALKHKLRRKIPDLLALAPCNDLFYVGSDLDWAKGQWFQTLWMRLGFSHGVQLRRIHYRILDFEDRQKHDGMQPDLRHHQPLLVGLDWRRRFTKLLANVAHVEDRHAAEAQRALLGD